MKSNDIERQQPMLCNQKFNYPLAILLSIHYFTLTFVASSPNNFLRCSRIKGVTRGGTRFRAVLDKLSKFQLAVPRDVKFPRHCKTIKKRDVRKEGF